jgi:hypothetical protein
MSKTKKVNIRLHDDEGYVVLTRDDMFNIAALFEVVGKVEDRSTDYKRAWIQAAQKFTDAITTVNANEGDTD